MTSTVQALQHVAPGSVVVVRDEEWLVTGAEETADGLLVRVHGLSPLVRDTTASFYQSLDRIEPLDPAQAEVVADDSAQYTRSRLWLEATVRKSAVPLGDPSLTVAKGALADPLEYQHAAVRKALDPANLRPRILLADAVGLGKTLEIGMILSELVRRGRGERILVVSPRHVLEQMQQELWNRFALPFVRLDSAGIQRVRQRIPATRNPFTYYKRVIISIDTLKSDRYVASLQKQRWDAVVIDEAHNLTNVATLNNRLARVLSRSSEALVLASATPHNGRAESFAELVRLLDPTAVTPSGELVLADVDRLVVRRHRHSPEVASVVGASWAERHEPRNVPVDAGPQEDAIARELEDVWLFPPDGASPYSGKTTALFGWTLAKAFLSSAAALRETVEERSRRLGDGAEADRERAALRRLRALATDAQEVPSAKYERLVQHLREVGVGRGSAKRAVVFAERIATLRWLRERLPNDLGLDPNAVELMHGGLPDVEQQRVVDAFKQAHAPVRVLVTGDVASEGVNLHQQCHELIHYDIPWSLIRIEQRNGRIDRYGQRHRPRITTLLLLPSSERFAGDLRILTKLVEREHVAHRALGDSASLMGRYDVSAEEDAIRKVLAGQDDFDQVVKTPDEVVAGGGLEALFAQLAAGGAPFVVPSTNGAADGTHAATAAAGLYPDEVSFLQEAVQHAYLDPPASPGRGGVGWRRDQAFGTVTMVPPPDLVQRLEVLPQSYLADRRVTTELVLATTPTRAKERLAAALQDDSDSSWPDAHHLAPLHPALDWAADRALAELGRNRVPAVCGDVEGPTILLYGTLTNRRGHIVAATWSTATFIDPDAAQPHPLVTPHGSAREALESLGWTRVRTNTGAVPGIDRLQRLVRPAVEAARDQMGFVMAEAEGETARRVSAWSKQLRSWDDEAARLMQRSTLRTLRQEVDAEQRVADAMRPDRLLVRALLVVVPDEPAGGAA